MAPQTTIKFLGALLCFSIAEAHRLPKVSAHGTRAITHAQALSRNHKHVYMQSTAQQGIGDAHSHSSVRWIRQRTRTYSAFALALLVPSLAIATTSTAEHLHLGQKIALYFSGSGLPNWVVLSLISMLPAIELRGGVPVGNWMGLNPWLTLTICVLGNMLPIAPTLLALRSKAIRTLAKPLLTRAQKKLAGLPEGQSRSLALALFVGIPAPGTGAWTGAIIAYLLDMPFTESMIAIFAVRRV